MTQRMKILGLRVKHYHQFQNFYLNLTEPAEGNALEQVCLIGANGTGKSTLLKLLSLFLQHGQPMWTDQSVEFLSVIAIHLQLDHQRLWILKHHFYHPIVLLDTVAIEDYWSQFWVAATEQKLAAAKNQVVRVRFSNQQSLLEKIRLRANAADLAIYATPDGRSLLNAELPTTNLDQASGFFNNFKAFHISSYDQVEDFWNVLIYQIKKRERDELLFFSNPDTQKLTVEQARQQFNAQNPEILTALADQWNLILAKAGLAFDVENAVIPVQTTENLQAYIKSIKTGAQIPYNALSTGIRNFIFRLGHIYSLYFNRPVERGFLLVDEPETSLFPDLLYDIVARYQSIIQNTQFFVATHSPIIAAQFKPEERSILEFDDNHY
ncbi:MAG: ATP-binding protein, partial [Moorea sp. SIO3C2]|nr:ATP-binding protein [Moorena sp. SIO3C2]